MTEPKNQRHWQALGDSRSKLGLALSGGGFRASFFHLGVLRRLAELDLLRYVKVISTVSGGSIVGAHYYLLLKERLHLSAEPSREDYIAIVDTLEKEFSRGVSRNLRNRLFLNPLAHLVMFCWSTGLGRRMATLYNRYLYHEVTSRILQNGLAKSVATGAFSLNPAIALRDSANWSAPVAAPDTPETDEPLESGSIRNAGIEVSEGGVASITGRTLKVVHPHKTPKQIRYRVTEGLNWGRLAVAEPREGVPPYYNFTQEDIEQGRVAYVHDGSESRGDGFSFHVADDDGQLIVGVTTFEISIIPPINGPRLVINATSLNTGAPFRFTPLWAGEPEARRDRARSVLTDNLTLAEAAAASANFPPVFPPLTLPHVRDSVTGLLVMLTDGGVIDNEGIDALLSEGCTHIIASDAGGLLQVNRVIVDDARIQLMARVVSILSHKIRQQRRAHAADKVELLQKFLPIAQRVGGYFNLGWVEDVEKELDQLTRTFGLAALAMFDMGSDPALAQPEGALPPHECAAEIAALRTDLDAFTEVERLALMYQGYQLCDRFVRHDLVGYSTLPLDFPPDPSRYSHRTIPTRKVRFLLDAGKDVSLTLRALSRFPRTGRAAFAVVCLFIAFGPWILGGWDIRTVSGGALWMVDRGLEWRLLDPLGIYRGPNGLWWLLWTLALLLALSNARKFLLGLGKPPEPRGPRWRIAIWRILDTTTRGRRNLLWLMGPIPVALAVLGTLYAAGAMTVGTLLTVGIGRRAGTRTGR